MPVDEISPPLCGRRSSAAPRARVAGRVTERRGDAVVRGLDSEARRLLPGDSHGQRRRLAGLAARRPAAPAAPGGQNPAGAWALAWPASPPVRSPAGT